MNDYANKAKGHLRALYELANELRSETKTPATQAMVEQSLSYSRAVGILLGRIERERREKTRKEVNL